MDFLTYVLDYGKKGYDVHFASLAVMMMRSLGIPARYAEGYLITGNEAELLNTGDIYEVTDKNAHAWAEIYLDGIGWIVFDPTPGYTDELKYALPVGDEEADLAQDIISRNNQSIEEEEETGDDDQEIKRQSVETDKEVNVQAVVSAVFAVIIILFLLIVIIRSIILRKRLKNERNVMLNDKDLRKSSALTFLYAKKVIAYGCKIKKSDVFKDPDGKVSAYLSISGEDLTKIKNMMDEIWLSDHEVTEDVKKSALSWLALVEKTRKEKTGSLSLFISKYIRCREY